MNEPVADNIGAPGGECLKSKALELGSINNKKINNNDDDNNNNNNKKFNKWIEF